MQNILRLDLILLGTAGILLIGFLGKALEKRTSLPYILWLILFGIILGPILGILKQAPLIALSPYIVNVVLIITLFNAGLKIKLNDAIYAISRALVLSSTNFALSFLIAFIVSLFLSRNVIFSSLLGFSVAGISLYVTNALAKDKLSKKAASLAYVEAAIEEPLTIVFVLVLLSGILLNNASLAYVGEKVISEFSIGIVLGALFGMIWVPIMGFLQKNKYEYSYVASLAITFLIYLIINALEGSGPIGVLSFGLIISNGRELFKQLRYKYNPLFNISEESKSFNDLVTFLANSLFFVYFGALINIYDIFGLLIGVIIALLLAASRVASTKIALYGSAYKKSDKDRIASIAARGVGTALVATLPLDYNLYLGINIIDAAFAVIVTTILLSIIMMRK
jgi:NhaP-type Na+/H+ or K+/H+ antiporter